MILRGGRHARRVDRETLTVQDRLRPIGPSPPEQGRAKVRCASADQSPESHAPEIVRTPISVVPRSAGGNAQSPGPKSGALRPRC